MANATFTWGNHNSIDFKQSLDATFSEAVHWRPNLFKLPYGNIGKVFVSELARLFKAFAAGSALESVALKAALVMPILLLQKPSQKAKTRDLITCLERRMKIWHDGDLNELTLEGRAIQHRLPQSKPNENGKRLARSFAQLMFHGKTKAALRLLTDKSTGYPLQLDDLIESGNSPPKKVRDILSDKHPGGLPADPDSIVSDEPPPVHPVIFDSLDASCIRSAALHTDGAAGPSGIDALGWRRMCTSYKSASNELCQSLAATARRLCTCFVEPESISPLLACRLIALSKNPGVRPIGIGETVRRIIAKSVLSVIRGDIQDAAGTVQLCAGQISGTEAAVHAVRTLFERDETEAVMLVDASNAFNSLNRQVALANTLRLCRPLATVLINTYREPTELFVGGEVLFSREGTTQGDPLAMAMYAIATVPLINKLRGNATQIWYADDATAIGKLTDLKKWWDKICSLGPAYGCFPNATKTWLVTKKDYLPAATAIFTGTNVNVTSEGRPLLGAAIGTREFIHQHVMKKVYEWSQEIENLTTIAQTQPHAAYAAYTHGMVSKWSYLSRIVPDIGHLLEPLEHLIRTKLIPVVTGRPPPNDQERALFALPVRLVALVNPAQHAASEFTASAKITKPLTNVILHQGTDYSYEVVEAQLATKADISKQRKTHQSEAALRLKESVSTPLQRVMDLAQEKGASTWLTSLPIEEYGFSLHKGAFLDAVALRYGWEPSKTPSSCACGVKFTIEHAMSCPKGGFPSIRHNEVRDLTATLLTEVCHDVCVEPDLQPLTGEQMNNATAITDAGARLDIAANGFWGGRFKRTFIDVRVFNPHAQSNRHSSLSTCYRKHERIKKRAYEQRVREVEHASFTPLVLAATGGMANEATHFFKRLASLLAIHRDQPYNSTMAWLRCRLNFSLLRSAIQCIRGSRSSRGFTCKTTTPLDLVNSESRLAPLS